MVKSRVVLKVNCSSVGHRMSSDLKKNGVVGTCDILHSHVDVLQHQLTYSHTFCHSTPVFPKTIKAAYKN